MRNRTLTLILLCLLAPAAIAALPAGASAQQFSTQHLKLRLHRARHHLHVSRDHARRARTALADARTLQATLAAAQAPAAAQTPAPQTPATTAPATTAPTTTAPGTPDAPAAAGATLPPGMDAALAARLLADGAVTSAEIHGLERRVAHYQAGVKRWTKRTRLLAKRVRERMRIERWAKHGAWKPLIRIAARRYRISAGGLYHMMKLESGGCRTAGTMFKGLFQYLPSTWAASWNHWRRHSIFDGWAQIQATAYAISRGMGPSQWPNTYPMSF